MASEGWEREVLASIDRAIWEKPRLGDVRHGWKAVTPSQATVEQQPMAGSPRRLNDSALTPRDAQRYSNSAFPPRASRRVHDSAQTHHTHSRPGTERSPGIEHVPSQTRQLQEQVQLQSQALDRLEAEVEALHWEHGISQRPSLVPYRGMARVLLADALSQAPCSQTMSRIQFHQLLAAWVCRKLTRAAVDVIFYQ
ncbi:hypothetical protein QJQ45_017187 [Haematococcus lacustris]|nr:hypothetical protein QJQ45_017187 [Haematococcus lacustris]